MVNDIGFQSLIIPEHPADFLPHATETVWHHDKYGTLSTKSFGALKPRLQDLIYAAFSKVPFAWDYDLYNTEVISSLKLGPNRGVFDPVRQTFYEIGKPLTYDSQPGNRLTLLAITRPPFGVAATELTRAGMEPIEIRPEISIYGYNLPSNTLTNIYAGEYLNSLTPEEQSRLMAEAGYQGSLNSGSVLALTGEQIALSKTRLFNPFTRDAGHQLKLAVINKLSDPDEIDAEFEQWRIQSGNDPKVVAMIEEFKMRNGEPFHYPQKCKPVTFQL